MLELAYNVYCAMIYKLCYSYFILPFTVGSTYKSQNLSYLNIIINRYIRNDLFNYLYYLLL